MPLPPQPPAHESPAPAPGAEAEAALLDAFDWGRPLPPAPKLKGPAALDHHWLRAAATFDPAQALPPSPYAGGEGRREAEALRNLLKAPEDQRPALLKALPIRRAGTALALWRWGQLQTRGGAFDPSLRHAWEDRLLTTGPPLTRGYALRHALCWALAEQDDTRLAALRSLADPATEDILSSFQRLFGLLGGPSPVLRLWSLPDLRYQDLRLDQLGAPRLWISPPENGSLPDMPAGTAWIIPSATGSLDEREAGLTDSLLTEGKALAERLRAAGRMGHFAPSRAAFERLGLAWFPILIELDGQGNLHSVRMGDAAPRRP